MPTDSTHPNDPHGTSACTILSSGRTRLELKKQKSDCKVSSFGVICPSRDEADAERRMTQRTNLWNCRKSNLCFPDRGRAEVQQNRACPSLVESCPSMLPSTSISSNISSKQRHIQLQGLHVVRKCWCTCHLQPVLRHFSIGSENPDQQPEESGFPSTGISMLQNESTITPNSRQDAPQRLWRAPRPFKRLAAFTLRDKTVLVLEGLVALADAAQTCLRLSGMTAIRQLGKSQLITRLLNFADPRRSSSDMSSGARHRTIVFDLLEGTERLEVQ